LFRVDLPKLIKATAALFMSFVLVSCGDFGFTVHVLYGEQGRGDKGINDAAFRSVLEGRDLLDATLVQWTPKDRDDAGYMLTSVLSDPLRSPNELIILMTDTYDDLVLQVECQFRDRKVLHLEGAETNCSKVLSVNYRMYAPGFLAGVAAVNASATKTIAVIGGGLTSDVKDAAAGFIDGVEEAGGTAIATYLSPSANGFNNYDEGFRVADELYAEDEVDVIFVAAGATSLGVLEAAKKKNDRYVIGFDYDLSSMGENVVLGSVVKNLNFKLIDTMTTTDGGSFNGGHEVVGLRDDSVAFVVNPKMTELVGNSHESFTAKALTLELAYQGGQ
jgi:basic membrane protein A and related proteins